MALRIERIDFNPWGCFEDHSLSFSSKHGHVDLIYGPNASGKSTTSRGERSLLYGIGARTPDNHTYDYADLRIGARLQIDGEVVDLSRRKRRANSLVGPDGEALPDDPIMPGLRGLTEQVYQALFQVDHDTLVQGGAELLQGEGEIGASLFTAAAGIATLHGVLSDLDSDALRIFNPRARTTVLHQALLEHRDAEKRLRDATLRPSRHRDLTSALTQAEAECDRLTHEIQELDLRARAIERKRTIAPLLDAHGERVAELDELGDTPDLPDSAAAQRSDAQGRLNAGAAQLQRTTLAMTKLESEIEAFDVNAEIIARAEEIQTVKADVSALNKAAGDRRKREGELQEARAGLDGAAAIVGVEPSEVESLRRPATARRALDRFLSDRDELAARCTGAKTRVAEAERIREEVLVDIDNAPSAVDPQRLEAALTAALRAGVLSEQIEENRLQAELQRRTAAGRLARLDPSPPSIDALRTLAAPPREMAKRVITHGEALQQEAERVQSERDRLAGEEIALAEERESLALLGEPPTVEALTNARATRDAHWSEIRVLTAAGSTLEPAEADVFERALASADQIADARADHATQIERTAAAQARASRLERERAALADRDEKLDGAKAALAGGWTEAWAITGLPTISPEDSLSWLDERDAILDLDRDASEAQARADTLLKRERGHVEVLEALLSEHDPEIGSGASLETLVARGQAVVAEAQRQATARSTRETALSAAKRTLAAAQNEHSAAEQAWSAWEGAWPQRRAEAGLPASATPEAAQEIARAVEDGLGHLKRAADLERRIEGIDNDQSEFDARVRSLCEDLAPQLRALNAERAASGLHKILVDHEQRHAQREALLERRAAAQDELTATQSDSDTAQAEIDSLIATAGCKTADELPEIENRATRARTLRHEISEIEQRVTEFGEGRFSDLAAGAAEFDRERAAAELDEVHEQSESLRGQRDQVKENIGERKSMLAQAETDTDAVQAAQDVQLARAAVKEAAVAHTKAKLSAAVVRRAIDRYRRLHQDPLLHRANELFGRFTLGSFVELFVDIDEREHGVLIGRQRNRVLKRVPEMSKGTREQLFLALRIAAIERYVATSGPIPVIFDDVFIESDEPRSERIFEALGELAATTQVIVLTHHHHLIEVGRRALRDKLMVNNLPDAAPTLREAVAA